MPAMELHGQALLDYINGEEDARYILRRDDGIAYAPIYAWSILGETEKGI
jgi:hypothetical protein